MQEYNTVLSLRIDWADLDLFGHVNNVVFFRYIQAARVNYCEHIGLTSLNDNDQLSFMVASSQCHFKRPLKYPDSIEVATRAAWLKNTSLQLEYLIRNSEKEIVAEASDVIVVYDHHKKEKVVISEALRNVIREREGDVTL